MCDFPLGAGHGFTGRSSRPGFHVEARTLVEMPTAILDRQTADRTGTELCAAGLKRQTMEMTTQKSGVAFFYFDSFRCSSFGLLPTIARSSYLTAHCHLGYLFARPQE